MHQGLEWAPLRVMAADMHAMPSACMLSGCPVAWDLGAGWGWLGLCWCCTLLPRSSEGPDFFGGGALI